MARTKTPTLAALLRRLRIATWERAGVIYAVDLRRPVGKRILADARSEDELRRKLAKLAR